MRVLLVEPSASWERAAKLRSLSYEGYRLLALENLQKS